MKSLAASLAVFAGSLIVVGSVIVSESIDESEVESSTSLSSEPLYDTACYGPAGVLLVHGQTRGPAPRFDAIEFVDGRVFYSAGTGTYTCRSVSVVSEEEGSP